MIQSFKDLIVWQKAIELVKEIYKITNCLPSEEHLILRRQMRRSAISIPSNIAEGYARRKTGEYLRFLCISDGSAGELETQIIIAKKIYSNLNFQNAEILLQEIRKMLAKIIKKIEIKKRSSTRKL